MAEPIEMPLGLWTQVGRRKHKFNCICQVAPMCSHNGAWRIRFNRPSAAAMRPYVKWLWPLVLCTVIHRCCLLWKIQQVMEVPVSAINKSPTVHLKTELRACTATLNTACHGLSGTGARIARNGHVLNVHVWVVSEYMFVTAASKCCFSGELWSSELSSFDWL